MKQDRPTSMFTSRSGEASTVDSILDEISDRIQSGEDPNIETYCRQYPKHASRLRELEPAIRAMLAFAQSPQDQPDGGFNCPHKMLGDFRLIREIARGGMGVVYEAQQESLGRRVALKVLPFASVLDQRQLQRFRNEAQAAAMLKHPNIVTVYSVGSDRGVHFYAMELIQGQSLADVIAELNEATFGSDDVDLTNDSTETTPRMALSTERGTQSYDYFRNVSKLVRTVAEALDYAHQQGVVHRDIKPSNLLVDGQGRISIADFGLAQFQNENNLTISGDLLGTLRYMSPEQSEGKRLLDHRTDVYSLGLVLYELLTLRCAFGANDRPKLLRQISETEPAAPRKVRPQVPSDLETITLKAIAKDPESRYSSAQELADDLQRFLDHKPIRARRTSEWERSRRWMRRNPLVSSLLGAVFGLLAIVAIMATASAYRQTSFAKRATDLYDEVLENSYALTISSAYRAWSDGDLDRVEGLLSPLMKATSGNIDRPFELLHLSNRLKTSGDMGATICTFSHASKVSLSTDGIHLAALTDHDTVTIWDVSSLEAVDSISVNAEAQISAIAISPTASWLAVAISSDGIRLIHIADSAKTRELSAEDHDVTSLVFSPDEQLLVTADNEGHVWLYELADTTAIEGRLVDQFEPTHRPSAAFSPDGSMLATCGGWAEAVARVWRLPDLSQIASLRIAPDLHSQVSVEFSSDGQFLMGVGRAVKMWNTLDWSLVESFHDVPYAMWSGGFSSDDRVIGVGDQGLIRLFDVEERREIQSIRGHRSTVEYVNFSRANGSLISADRDGLIKVWPKSVWERAALSASPTVWFTGVCFVGRSSDQDLIVTRGQSAKLASEEGSLSLLNMNQHSWREIGRNERRVDIAASPTDLNLIAVSTQQEDGTWAAVLWDLSRLQRIDTLHGRQELIYSLAFSPDGRLLATADLESLRENKSRLIIWDVAERSPRYTLESSMVTGLAFSPDGKTLATTGGKWGEGRIRFLDIETGGWQAFELPCDMQGLCLQFIQNGELLVSGEMDGTLAVWDVMQRERLFSSNKRGRVITCLAVAPNGRTLAVGMGYSMVTLLDASTFSELAELPTPRCPTSLQFSGDGTRLAAGCTDGSVVMWDVNGHIRTFENPN